MKKSSVIFTLFTLSYLLFSATKTFAQCEVFKSEIKGVENYMANVQQLTDSLSVPVERVGFEASFKKASSKALEIERILGKALDHTYDAASMAGESQDHSKLCGLKEVVSNTIETERQTIDARELAELAYDSAKRATKANNLGNLQYYVRIAHRYARDLKEVSATAVSYAEIAHHACEHGPEHGLGSGK